MRIARIHLTLVKRQQQLVLVSAIAALAIYAGLSSVKWWLASAPLLIFLVGFVIGRSITTRKNNLIVLKTLRPLLIIFGIILSITAGNGQLASPAWLIILISLGLVAVLSLLIRHELAAQPSIKAEHGLGLLSIFCIANSASLALAVWNTPLWLVLLVSWLMYYIIANFWLYNVIEKPESLAIIWSLLALEIGFISSFWIIFYSLPKTNLLISQSSLIIVSLAYSLGGIYYHHRQRDLSKSLVFEYLAVVVLIFGVLLLLTKWLNTV